MSKIILPAGWRGVCVAPRQSWILTIVLLLLYLLCSAALRCSEAAHKNAAEDSHKQHEWFTLGSNRRNTTGTQLSGLV